MRVGDALSSAGLDGLDKEVLLSVVLGKERTWILAHPEYALGPEEEVRWREWSGRRRRGEPVAYVIGYREFFGRSFETDPSTLIPRPATEALCSVTLELLAEGSGPVSFQREIDAGIVADVRIAKPLAGVRLVADIGTGSGCVGITLACERPDLRVVATDVSPGALAVAAKNARHHHVHERVSFALGKNLEPLEEVAEPFLIVSNPPYIPDGTPLEKDVMDFEPHGALFAGPDGTDILRDIASAAKRHPYCVGTVIECRTEQAGSGMRG